MRTSQATPMVEIPKARTGRRRRLVLTAIGVVAVMAAISAGCSSGGSSKSSSTIRIGLEGPLSGSQSDTGTAMLRGAQMAAEELNAKGGIGGRKVEIVPIDDKADPEAGTAAATAAVAKGLEGVVGPYNSGVGLRTLPIYTAAGLVPLRFTSADTTAGLGFTLQPMTSQIAPVATDAIVKWAKATSVALIVDSTQTYNKDAAAAMAKTLPAAGARITTTVEITPGGTSYADAVAKALATNPQLVYVVAYYPEAGLVAKAMADAGTAAKCLADFGAYDNGFVTAAGTAAATTCPLVGVPAPDDFPGAAERVTAFNKKFGTGPGVWSPYAYDSVLVLADAIGRAGSTAAADVSAALAATKGWSGWTGTVSFASPSGNRVPAPVTVNVADNAGMLHVDASWVAAVGFVY
ncbi:MAG: branched-chain amino acid ABC transporter substrate-binding protein [Acidimicrobiia bacterium]